MKTTISSSTSRNLNELTKILNQQALQAQDWPSEAATFIPLRGSWYANNEDEFDLEGAVHGFLKSERRVLLLLGDSGAGKSLYTQKLAMELANQDISNNNSDANLIPVWISLPSLKNPTQQAIEETLTKLNFSSEEIELLRNQGRFVFILDAYDEIHTLKNLYVTNQLQSWNAKIIITCRREYLYQVENYALYFLPYLNGILYRQAYQEIVIRPFNTKQIDSYLQQYVKAHPTPWPDASVYQQAIDEIPGLKTLLATPFLLKIALTVLPILIEQYRTVSLNKKPFITQCALYDAFINQWFDRQEKKLKDNNQIPNDEDIKPQFWSYAKSLAKAMHEAHCTQIAYATTSDLLENTESNTKETPWKKWLDPQNAKIKLLQTACLVREVSSQHYAFIHSSLLDYFIARELYETLQLPELDAVEAILSNTDSIAVQPESNVNNNNFYSKVAPVREAMQVNFNQHLLVKEANILQFLADRVKEDDTFKTMLFAQIEASKKDEEMQIAAANAITILNYAEVSFAGLDLAGIRIPSADLGEANLENANLTGANLQGVRLARAWLRQADLRKGDLTGVVFEERPVNVYGQFVHALAWHPKGRYLAVGVDDGLIIEDRLNGARQNFHEQILVMSVAWSPKGELASGNYSKSIIVRNAQGQVWQTLWEHTEAVGSVAWSASGELASGSDDRTVIVWDVQRGEARQILRGHTEVVKSVAWSPSGELASCGDDRTIIVWNVLQGQARQILHGHTESVESVAWSPSGELASGSNDHTIIVWDVLQEQARQILRGHTGRVESVAWSVSGELASGSDDHTVIVWDVLQRQPRQILHGHTDWIKSVAWSPSGELASCSNIDETVHVWDVNQGRVRQSSRGHTGWVYCIASSPSGELASSGHDDHTVIVWDVCQGQARQVLHGYVGNVAWSARGELAVAVLSEIEIVRNIQRSDEPEVLYGHHGVVWSLAWSANGELASGSNDRTVIVWDVQQGEVRQTLRGHTEAVKSVAWSPSGELASSSDDHTIIVWDVKLGQTRQILHAHTDKVGSVAWSPSGELASGSDDKTVIVWDVRQGQARQILHGHTKAVRSVAWSASGELASGSSDQTLIVWDILQSQPKIRLGGHFKDVTSIDWLTVNKQILLAAGCGDGAVKVWQRLNQQTQETWQLLWTSHWLPYLFAEDCKLEGVIGLTAEQIYLLKEQKKASGEPSIERMQKDMANETDLHRAAQKGQASIVETLLTQGGDKDAKLIGGYTPLHLAVQEGHTSVVELLLVHGADKEAKDNEGWTALYWAIQKDHASIVELLLAHGADKEAKDNEGCTALHWAIQKENVSLVESLLAQGADKETKDKEGRTALHRVAQKGHASVVKLLLAQGADIEAVSEDDGTALHLAAREGHSEVVELLLEHGADSEANKKNDGFTALHHAASNGHRDVAKLLLTHGADKEAKCFDKEAEIDGWTALHVSAASGHLDVVKVLVEEQANIHARNSHDSVIHQAVYSNNQDIINLLLDKGAAIDALDSEGNTPLMWAILEDEQRLAIMELLLKRGANLSYSNYEGNTLLHLAAKKGQKEVVQFLLARCIDYKAINKENKTAGQLAVENDHSQIAQLIENYAHQQQASVAEKRATNTTKTLTKYFEQLDLQAREAKEAVKARPSRAATLPQKSSIALPRISANSQTLLPRETPNGAQGTIIAANQLTAISNLTQDNTSHQPTINTDALLQQPSMS